jgi:hypothetical protein
MDWTYPRPPDGEGDPGGLSVVLRRLADELGTPVPKGTRFGTSVPKGTRFLFDRRDMMEATREIESVAHGALLVGFQRGEKLDGERSVYDALADRGVEVTAFGAGRPADPSRVTWVELPLDVRPVENQWFLVIAEPEPLAFVSYELSEPDRFGTGGISDRVRSFAGFVTRDERVIDVLRRHLGDVARRALTSAEPAPAIMDAARDARTIVVATDDAPDGWSRGTLLGGIAIAKAVDADVILVDRSAESYLVDPYPYSEVLDGTRTLDRDDVVSLGRRHLADQMDEADKAGVRARAWLPRRPGPRGMTELVERQADRCVVVLPDVLTRPSLFDRIRGEVLSRWREVVPALIVVAGIGGELRLAANPRLGARVGMLA